jgi:Uma2 family endonuclease
MAAARTPAFETVGELVHQLGDIDPDRIRLQPQPGTATEKDLLSLRGRTERIFELVDGTLVEKVMGYDESSLTLRLAHFVHSYLDRNDRGNLAGPDGTMRLMPGLLRVPDLSFVLWERLGGGPQVPEAPIADLAPDLAVEVLSESNTLREMERKLKEYFLAGVRLVWLVDPDKRTVQVATAPDCSVTLREGDVLDGGDVLPGFSLALRDLFARVPRRSPRRRSAAKKRRRGKNS